ncbi:MAG: phage portal protein [Lachnospiraceae bacterium]|nr:phage portal protein [Lachnospiraceae bacterium]
MWLAEAIRSVLHKMIPYTSIESVENIETPLSTDMINALDEWYKMYINQPTWVVPEDKDEATVKSLNLPSFIASEIARQIIIELNWDITGKSGENGDEQPNPRAKFLKEEFTKVFDDLRQKLEQGCAAGGMTLRPYPKDEHIHFAWTCDWALYPVSFGSDGNLIDVIFRDTYTEGQTIYTRLERHVVDGDNVIITQRAFKSTNKNSIGTEINLKSVPIWADLEEKAIVENAEGQMFGWFKVAAANSVDVESPMGTSVYAKAKDLIREADKQYSRLMWEYEGSELAIDVDPTAMRPNKNGDGKMEMPKLNKRLFRAVDIDKGDRDLYEVFSPAIRDSNLVNGLNQLLMRIEDLTGLSRGTIADANISEARTATEMRILKQRSYATISDNQKALETCFKDVIRAMDKLATLYNLAPEGEYEVSFDWDDSILVDKSQELNEDLALVSSSLMSKVEFRMRHFGETKAQAQAALQEIMQENATSMQSLIPGLNLDNINNPPTGPEGGEEPDNGVKGVSPPGGSQPKQTTTPTKPTA